MIIENHITNNQPNIPNSIQRVMGIVLLSPSLPHDPKLASTYAYQSPCDCSLNLFYLI